MSELTCRNKKTRLVSSDGFMIFYSICTSLSPRLKASVKMMMMWIILIHLLKS